MATTNEALRDSVVRHSVYLAKYGEGLADKVVALLNSADADIVAKIAAGLTTQLSEKRLKELLEEVRALNSDVYGRIFDKVEGELTEQATATAEYEAKALTENIPVEYRATLPSPAKLKVLATTSPIDGHLLKSWTDQMDANRLGRVEKEIRLGILQGETIDQIVSRIRGTKANKYKDGILEKSRQSVKSMVLTANATVAAQAREETWKANAKIIKALMWVATLDSRTSPVCQSRDGKTWPMGEPHPTTPAHIRCRSLLIPVTKSFDEMGIPKKEISRTARASMDGAVPASTTYEDWLARQSEERQNDALDGKARGDLYRSGKLPFNELFRSNGSYKSVNELRAALGVTVPPSAPKVVPKPVEAPPAPKVDTKALDDRERDYCLEMGRKTGVEYLVGYNARTGDVIERKKGSKSSVSFSPDLTEAIKNPDNEIVLHHNHPSSSSFSYQDIHVINNYPGAKGIWAHAHNSSSYYAEKGQYELKKRTVDAISDSLVKSLQRKINMGDVAIEDAQLIHQHLVWLAVHEVGQVKYSATLAGPTLKAWEKNKDYYEALLEALKA